MYLVQYAGDNLLDYRVRALDTGTGRLAARDIVDPREPDEQMGGLPFDRAVSRDGRWFYTLYGGGHETFIHALDTVGQTAACIDLPSVPESELGGLGLSLSRDGRTIRVVDGAGYVSSVVNTRTFAVSQPGQVADTQPAADLGSGSAQGGDGFPWLPALVAIGLAAIAIAAVAVRRQRPA
jgi:hypothetical protein